MRKIDHWWPLVWWAAEKKGGMMWGENGHLSSLLTETSHMKACL